ncbi:MAG: hypothetical protein J6Y17_01745 [Elusimicrobiaceae bacterium]|nr:hypothetical protein [Elusimicrobiaceae bacterium]
MKKKLFVLAVFILSMEGIGFSQKKAIVEQLSKLSTKTKIACTNCLETARQLPTNIRLAVLERQMYMQASKAVEEQSLAAKQMGTHNSGIAFKKMDENPYLELHQKLNLPNDLTLQTDKQALNYTLAQMNRWETYAIAQREEKAQKILKSMDLLREHLQTYTHPEEQDMAWLAQQIPANTQYLLLGEFHKKSLRPSIQQFMKELRTRFRNRRIILLTEFLQKGHSSELDDIEIYNDRFTSYQKIYDEAKANGIEVFGLESPLVKEYWFFFASNDNLPRPLWESQFGIKLRNQMWLKSIEKYHQENPDALIVIYGGFAHMGYTEPFSIGVELTNRAPTFMASFTLGYPRDAAEKSWTEYSAFDYVTKGEFDQRIVQFAPEDAQITGFDIQVKVRAEGEDE